MSVTAAASGFVVLLLTVTVVQCENGWDVSYTSTEICAVRGSTVDITCTYTYPSTFNNHDTTVQETIWFIKESNGIYVDLRTDPEYSGRVENLCGNNKCTLRISNLRESDSAVYKFRFTTNQPTGSLTGSAGVTLSVTDPQLQVHVRRSTANPSSTWTELTCHSRCQLPDHLSYVWYNNNKPVGRKKYFHLRHFNPEDSYHCAIEGQERFTSPTVYAAKPPSVSVSPSGEIMEGSSVTLTCSSDANPAAKYTWYKENQTLLNRTAQLVFSSIRSSDSGEYYCAAENENTASKRVLINVKYAPQSSSVSVSPSGEIMEGSSVTLTCSSDANPAAHYTWYKENRTLLQGPEGVYRLSSISSGDSGVYSCKSENQYGRINSTSLHLDVQYAPKPPSVSVSPSGEIMEGSSVTLTCSSDANPAANYTWYKEDEDSPTASGQNFTITNITAEHGGKYQCEVQNTHGRSKATFHLTVGAVSPVSWRSALIGSAAAVFLAVTLLSVFLLIRKKRNSHQSADPGDRLDHSEQRLHNQSKENCDLNYASVHFRKRETDPSEHKEAEEVVYAPVKFNRSAPRTSGRDTGEDPALFYSTVQKHPAV
ncbi:B-cell receptor CD22-like [Platichthys flesus]|uniref:B-cell receptor CD22-like n=1 Tax=Platichthys flesus TaxID=8260 RepID=UPI002DBCE3BA|nr:B-cell receptor CD22-like [Platichthys flesus]